MLREQLLGLAMRTLSQAYETKERIKNNLNTEAVQNYIRNAKETALWVIEYQWQRFRKLDRSMGEAKSGPSTEKTNARTASEKSAKFITKVGLKRARKSSIKPAKEIGSTKAEAILLMLKNDGSRLLKKHESIDKKTSLAYLIWALGHAKRAHLADGISVHDVSALLYRACNIELYPINISRVVYGNAALVMQVGQQKRTKTYLLTTDGEALFKENFL